MSKQHLSLCAEKLLKVALVSNLFLAAASLTSAGEKRTPEDSRKKVEQYTLTPSSLFEFQFPVDAGILSETWIPPVKKPDSAVVIHIQDAHCQYEAQMNMARLIEKLVKKYGIKLVAVEGTDGPIDTSSLGNLSGDGIKDKVMKYFVRQGKITGPEYLSIMKKVEFSLIGIEDTELYDANFRAFKAMLPYRKKAQQLCENLSSALFHLKKYIYSEELQVLDELITSHREGNISLPDYCLKLNTIANFSMTIDKPAKIPAHANFDLFVQSMLLEKQINSAEQEKELQNLLQKLSQTLPKDDLSKIISAGLQLRLGKIKQTDYYRVLEEVLNENSSQPALQEWRKKWPQTSHYMEYSKVYEKIDTMNLFEEIETLSDFLMHQLLKNDDQKNLYAYTNDIQILERLLLLETSRKDLKFLNERKNEFDIKNMIKFVKEKAKSYPGISLKKIKRVSTAEWSQRKDDALNFYRLANLRDQTLVKNTLKAMSDMDARSAIMVTGGYHTEGICDVFRKQGIAYVVLCPKITEDQADNPYLDVMKRQKSSLEEFLTRVEKTD